MVSKPVEPEGRATGELARGPEGDQALEQPAAGAVAQPRDRRRGGDGVVAEQRLERPPLPFRPQFWRGLGELFGAAGQVLGEVEGGERRAGVSERDELAPARAPPGRGRRPSPASGGANSSPARRGTATGQRERFGERGVGAKEGERLGVGARRRHRLGGRGRDERRRPAAPGGLLQRGGELPCPVEVERRLQVGGDGGEPLRRGTDRRDRRASRKAA